MVNAVSGANEKDRHYRNVNIERDASVKAYADLRIIQEGDPSPDGKARSVSLKGLRSDKSLNSARVTLKR